MNILAIDTTSTGLSIALVKGEEIHYFTKEIGKSGHSATLMPQIESTSFSPINSESRMPVA